VGGDGSSSNIMQQESVVRSEPCSPRLRWEQRSNVSPAGELDW